MSEVPLYRERERVLESERERASERDREKERERETYRQRETDRQRERERERKRERERERDRERERQGQRARERERIGIQPPSSFATRPVSRHRSRANVAHIKRQGQIQALAFRSKSLNPFQVVLS